MTNLQWQVLDMCPSINPDTGHECQNEQGHTGIHISTEWKDGEIVGLICWQQDE